MSRFATTSDAELLRVIENGHAKNTRKANERAASLLKCYLKEKNMPVNFAHFSKKELNDVLAQFYINVRQVNGEKYKVSSLENLRHGLNNEPPSREGLRHHTRCRISRSERELSSSFKAVENRRKRCCRSPPCYCRQRFETAPFFNTFKSKHSVWTLQQGTIRYPFLFPSSWSIEHACYDEGKIFSTR